MGWKINNRDNRFVERKGLEGPFYYASGRVLYYDPKECAYWDPLTDFYLDRKDMEHIHQETMDILKS